MIPPQRFGSLNKSNRLFSSLFNVSLNPFQGEIRWLAPRRFEKMILFTSAREYFSVQEILVE